MTVVTSWGEQLTGLVYSQDRQNNIIVLQLTTKRDELEFRLLTMDGLTITRVPSNSLKHTRVVKFPEFNEDEAREREQAAIAKSKAAAQKIGKGVNREAQQIFNAIELIYPQTRWEGTDIVVLGEVCVRAPYRVQDVRRVKDTNSANASPIANASPGVANSGNSNAGSQLLRIVQSIVEKKNA